MTEQREHHEVRLGECRRCGICCKGDAISPGKFSGDAYVREFVEIIGRDCEHLQWDSEHRAVCGIYPNRPPECREFPRRPEDLDLINGPCGFYFTPKGRKERREEKRKENK